MHITPLPVYPVLHEHVGDPVAIEHVARVGMSQPPLLLSPHTGAAGHGPAAVHV
jgi:hypothetical protein